MSDTERVRAHFFAALDGIDAADFDKAETELRLALALAPANASILTNLAVVLRQRGKRVEAREIAERATAATADNVEAMLVLADCYAKDDEGPERALALLDRVTTLDPQIADAHNNRGLVLRKLGRLAEALESLDRAIALEPALADAHCNRASVLGNLHRYDEALAAYDQALKLDAGHADAWFGRGNVLAALLRYDEANAAYRHAAPRKAEALHALVLLLLSEGNVAEALKMAQRAGTADATQETKSLIASCLASPLVTPAMGDLRPLIERALTEPWTRPASLAVTGATFLTLNRALRDAMARATAAWPRLLPQHELMNRTEFAAVAEDRLLQGLLTSAPVCTVSLERFATNLRAGLLAAATSGTGPTNDDTGLAVYAALARQCFINDYAFAQSEPETAQIRELRKAVGAALGAGADVPSLALLAVAAYEPLHTLPQAAVLLERALPAEVAGVVTQQIREPIEERRLRAAMPALTPIGDGVSAQVREQYEENPYPRWMMAPQPGRRRAVDDALRDRFPSAPLAMLGKRADADYLVAGCGTGQLPIAAASAFKARLLAIDLSLASLGYAQRQVRALGLDNIEFAQADIMRLGALGRSFDVIDASGVLHHLADPFAGWRVLLSLLRPRGLMSIGLYSEAARRDLVAAREFIAARGYPTSPDGIRRCRQDLFAQPPGSPLHNMTLSPDFYSLSGCRDLLFHVQEHRLTIPQVAAFLAENGLQFLGFDIDPQTCRNYAQQFPHDVAMIDLAQWHRYETDHPRTFGRMYQFWVQRT